MELRRPPVLLFDDALAPCEAPASLLFSDAEMVLVARQPEQVLPILAKAEAALARGRHIAGFIAFEAAAALEPAVRYALEGRQAPEPLVWFGVFAPPRRLARRDVDDLLVDANGGTSRRAALVPLGDSEDEVAYESAFRAIMARIAEGDVYQINHVFTRRYRLDGDPVALYRRLRHAQPVAYGAYIDTGEGRVISLSPELFVRSVDGRLEARPMKGTAARGADNAMDDEAARLLQSDPKSRAENLMIVDLLRNDLARIAGPRSVTVPALFDVERYPSLLQMTSRIEARRRDGTGLSDLLAALFPCGSVTGAPKIRAIERIAETESGPRGLYTGAIGWAAPDGDLAFSVAIRTLVEESPGHFRFGIGSGLVADSDCASEYGECLMKTRFLDTGQDEDFALVETMRASRGKVRDIALHFERLADAARYFGFACDLDEAAAMATAAAWNIVLPRRLRVLLGRSGAVSVMSEALTHWPRPLKLMLAREPLDAMDPFVRFKTTRRNHYDAPLAAAQAQGFDEILFSNRDGFLTEGARTNLFVSRNGRLMTPPLADGLLPGILRRKMLESGRAVEASISLDDLRAADGVAVGNSLRGMMAAVVDMT